MGNRDLTSYPSVALLWLAWGETPQLQKSRKWGDTKLEPESKNLWVLPCPTSALI